VLFSGEALLSARVQGTSRMVQKQRQLLLGSGVVLGGGRHGLCATERPECLIRSQLVPGEAPGEEKRDRRCAETHEPWPSSIQRSHFPRTRTPEQFLRNPGRSGVRAPAVAQFRSDQKGIVTPHGRIDASSASEDFTGEITYRTTNGQAWKISRTVSPDGSARYCRARWDSAR